MAVYILKIPVSGPCTRLLVSEARSEAPYNHNGEVVFSGLFHIAEWVPLYYRQYTVDPNNVPRSMPGFWEDYKDEEDDEEDPDTSDHDDMWVLDISLICDENGRLTQLPINQNARKYVGTVYIVKRLFNTYTGSEVALSLDSTDIPLLKGLFPNANMSEISL